MNNPTLYFKFYIKILFITILNENTFKIWILSIILQRQ